MSTSIKKTLIIDLESTCFEGMPRSEQNQITEIIEIGITEVNIIKKQIIRTDSWLVKPQKTSITEYCTKLTGISDLMVQEKGLTLQAVSEIIQNEYNAQDIYYAAWGNDNLLIERAFSEYNLTNPFSNKFLNLKDLYCIKYGQHLPDRFETALKRHNLVLKGDLHRAGSDSYNAAQLFLKIFE